jgi:hypothetical protein
MRRPQPRSIHYLSVDLYLIWRVYPPLFGPRRPRVIHSGCPVAVCGAGVRALVLIVSGRDQRMRNHLYAKHDAIQYSNLSHKFGYVCFYGALFYPKRSSNLLV